MRKFLIAAATAASALAVAAPASAQYYPQPRGHAYGSNNYGGLRSLQARHDVGLTIRTSIHPAYDALILTATRDWKYKPATLNGKPVSYRRLISINVQR